jgi:hypothetical protein
MHRQTQIYIRTNVYHGGVARSKIKGVLAPIEHEHEGEHEKSLRNSSIYQGVSTERTEFRNRNSGTGFTPCPLCLCDEIFIMVSGVRLGWFLYFRALPLNSLSALRRGGCDEPDWRVP